MEMVAKKFEWLLDTYRRPDGKRWSGQDLAEATGGVVTRSYVSMLRKGKITDPGMSKGRAIARVMGFPPELWFEELPGEAVQRAASGPEADASLESPTFGSRDYALVRKIARLSPDSRRIVERLASHLSDLEDVEDTTGRKALSGPLPAQAAELGVDQRSCPRRSPQTPL